LNSAAVWVFDLDNTLHNATPHIFPHISRAMTGYLQTHLGLDEHSANALRIQYWHRYGATLLGLIRHHPEIDPDHWVAVNNPFLVLWRCLTIVFWYQRYFWRHIAFHPHIPGMRPLTIHIVVAYLILYGIAFGLSVFGWWREVLALWIVPHILASALIIYFFAYLTHKPHEVHERYRDTNVFWVKGRILEPIVNWLYMFQNFHLIHHLFPRIPFYLYAR